MTPAASYAGSAVSDHDVVPMGPEPFATRSSLDNPDLLRQLGGGGSTSGAGAKSGDELKLALLNASKKVASEVVSNGGPGGGYVVKPQTVVVNEDEYDEPPPPEVPKRSTSYDMLRNGASGGQESRPIIAAPKLSPPTPFADNIDDNNFVADRLPHIMLVNNNKQTKHPVMSKTLPRRLHQQNSSTSLGSTSTKHLFVNHRKSLTESTTAIPPPPQYKGVHFAPHVEERRRSADDEDLIPVEGLPTKPAVPRPSTVRLNTAASASSATSTVTATTTPVAGETVAITVRKANPVPILNSVVNKAVTPTGSCPPTSTFGSAAATASTVKTPPAPPPKTSTLSTTKSHPNNHQIHHQIQGGGQVQVMGVRDKALAASAAGREIVFVSPDEGFNETSTSPSSSSTSNSVQP